MKSVRILIWLLSILLIPSGLLGGLLNCGMERADSTAVVTAEKRIESVDMFEVLIDDHVKTIRESEGFEILSCLFMEGGGIHVTPLTSP